MKFLYYQIWARILMWRLNRKLRVLFEQYNKHTNTYSHGPTKPV